MGSVDKEIQSNYLYEQTQSSLSGWGADMAEKGRDLNFSNQVKPNKHVAGVNVG